MKQPSQRISLPPDWDARHSTIIGLPVLTRQEWFSTECHRTDQSNYSGQSQRAQTIPQSNQNMKQIHCNVCLWHMEVSSTFDSLLRS